MEDTFGKSDIRSSLSRLEKWVEAHEYKGYEPFDGLSSFLKPLAFGNLLLKRVMQQLVRRFPINIRPLIGIKPLESTKGRGYMAWGYITMYTSTHDVRYKEKTEQCLEWLIENKSPYYREFSWGNHYDFASRRGLLPKYEPIIVWSSLIGQAFVDMFEIVRNNRYLEVAKSICDWILQLPREITDSGACLSYVAYTQSSIHNSNMLGAALLAIVAKHTKDEAALKTAKEAMIYSCSRQLPDGGWYYGEEPMYHWIDNFHTGYNLDSLKSYIDSTGDKDYQKNLKKGYEYYINSFFEDDGMPKYYHNNVYPVDIQCASQAIETLARFSKYDERSLHLAKKVARWTILNMQNKDGYFYFRKNQWGKIKTPMIHWGQATMYKALAELLAALDSEKA
jgi:rhamnogalacturonyl hydrolase YesR